MSLDLTKVASQVGSMVARLKADREERQKRLQHALDTLHSQATDLDPLKKKLSASKTTWLVAGLVDGLDQHYRVPPTPAEFTVISTDGSHIDIERHKSTRCFLINIGSITLRYGDNPDARLDSSPRLYFDDEELVIPPATNSG